MSSDILQARREARRRKILENSENRLKRITGRSELKENLGPNGELSSTTGVVSNGKVEYENKDCLYFPSPAQTTNCTLPAANFYSDEFNSSTSEVLEDQEQTSSQTSNQLRPSTLFYISMAVLLRLLLGLDVLYLCGDSMVIAFLLMECATIGVYGLSIHKPSGYSWTSLFLLLGMKPRYTIPLIHFVDLTSSVLRDFALYTFTFILTELLIDIFWYLF